MCNNCPPQIECTCAVQITTNCVTLTGGDLTCSGIEENQLLTDVIRQLDLFICEKFESIASLSVITNVGTGSQVYKGVDSLGRKQLRTITGTGGVTVTQNADTINISVAASQPLVFGDGDGIDGVSKNILSGAGTVGNPYRFVPKETSFVNLGSGISFFKDTSLTADPARITRNFRTLTFRNLGGGTGILSAVTGLDVNTNTVDAKSLTSTNGSVIITNTINTVDLSVTGAETKVQAGTNVTVTGTGTTASPYIINAAGGGVVQGLQDVIVQNNDINIDALVDLIFESSLKITSSATSIRKPYFLLDTNSPDFCSGGAKTEWGITDLAGNVEEGIEISTFTTGIRVKEPFGYGMVYNFSNTNFFIDDSLITKRYVAQETANKQSTITTSTTLNDSYYQRTVFINNGASNITITIPNTLVTNFSACFVQQGTGLVTFAVSGGAVLQSPSGYTKIKGQNHWAYVEKFGSTSTIHLLGSLNP